MGDGDQIGDGDNRPNVVGTSGAIRVLKSADLFAEAREVIIDHDGDHYRLRYTSKGKLILTK